MIISVSFEKVGVILAEHTITEDFVRSLDRLGPAGNHPLDLFLTIVTPIETLFKHVVPVAMA